MVSVLTKTLYLAHPNKLKINKYSQQLRQLRHSGSLFKSNDICTFLEGITKLWRKISPKSLKFTTEIHNLTSFQDYLPRVFSTVSLWLYTRPPKLDSLGTGAGHLNTLKAHGWFWCNHSWKSLLHCSPMAQLSPSSLWSFKYVNI